MRLGTDIRTEDILHKFDSAYGVVETNNALLAKFYSAKQRQEGNIQVLPRRLDNTWFKALQHGLVEQHNMDEMLRSIFWKGLRPCAQSWRMFLVTYTMKMEALIALE